MTLDMLDSLLFTVPKKGTKTCNTIRSLTENFPTIVGNNCFCQDNNKIFDILKELKLPEIIENYLRIVKNNIHKLNNY